MQTGLDVLLHQPEIAKSWGRLGVLLNQASVDAHLQPGWVGLSSRYGDRLRAFFGPQHGIGGTEQYNMIETAHGVHGPTGLPVYSLYSHTRRPSGEMLSDIDTFVVDLQISGCRIYTWKATIAAILEAAREHGKKVVILDRPNPLGGEVVEGRSLDDEMHSFVGVWPAPMRHGLTAAEAGRYLNEPIGADLQVISLRDWDPHTYWPESRRPWVLTSPMLPTFDSVVVYPGMVLVEGTGMSEGRGTTMPFQMIGAPYVKDPLELVDRVGNILQGVPPGVKIRDTVFTPTWNKWHGQAVGGVQILVTEPTKVRSYRLALAVIRAFIEIGGDQFAWEKPGYEYDHENLPINLLAGSKQAADRLVASDFSLEDSFWYEGIDAYLTSVQASLLYERKMRSS